MSYNPNWWNNVSQNTRNYYSRDEMGNPIGNMNWGNSNNLISGASNPLAGTTNLNMPGSDLPINMPTTGMPTGTGSLADAARNDWFSSMEKQAAALETGNTPDTFSQEGMFGDSGWFAPTVQGIASLGNMYLGYQALNAQEDYMNNQIRLAEQQLANSQTSYNNSYDRVQQAAANSMSNEALGLPADATPEQRQQAQQAYVENQKVNHVGTQNG